MSDRAALDLLGSLVRSALAIEEGRPAAPPPGLGAVAPAALLEAVRRHRVPEVLLTHARELELPDEVVEVLSAWRRVTRHRLLLQTLETVRAWDLLTRQGIDALVFKGQALAVQTTGLADARGAGDVDVLVAPATAADAHRVLSGAGWALSAGGRVDPGTWAWQHVSRWGNALTYLGDGGDVDLHWRLEATPGAHPDVATLWARRREVEVGGARIATLGSYDALRHSAAHREGWVWLRTLVDLRRLARDPHVFAGELRPVAAVSLALARETVGLPDTVPGWVHAQLDRVPAPSLDRARGYLRAAVPGDFGGGTGSVLSFRHRLASSRTAADLRHAAVALVLPAHAALPVHARTAWTGVPTALALRARRLVAR